MKLRARMAESVRAMALKGNWMELASARAEKASL